MRQKHLIDERSDANKIWASPQKLRLERIDNFGSHLQIFSSKLYIYICIFYLRLYGVRYMVKDHTDSEKGNPLPPHRLLFPINSKGYFICTTPHVPMKPALYISLYVYVCMYVCMHICIYVCMYVCM